MPTQLSAVQPYPYVVIYEGIHNDTHPSDRTSTLPLFPGRFSPSTPLTARRFSPTFSAFSSLDGMTDRIVVSRVSLIWAFRLVPTFVEVTSIGKGEGKRG